MPAIVQNFHKVHALESHKKFSERVFTQLKLNKIVKERVHAEHAAQTVETSKSSTVTVSLIISNQFKTCSKQTTQQNQGVKLMCFHQNLATDWFLMFQFKHLTQSGLTDDRQRSCQRIKMTSLAIKLTKSLHDLILMYRELINELHED